MGLWLVAVAATVLALYAWWSAVAGDGLYLIGIALATPVIVLAAPLLLLLGRLVGRLLGRLRRAGSYRAPPYLRSRRA